MDTFDIKQLTIEYLFRSPLGDDLGRLEELYEKVQENITALANSDDSESLKKTKIGTVLTFSVVRKIMEGKNPKEFTQDDWKDIANAVSEKAILMDSKDYSKFIFKKYSQYIDTSASLLEGVVNPNHLEAISNLAAELRAKEEALNNDEITEVTYIEDCLWISLEAMIKLLSAYYGRLLKYPEFDDLLHAVTGFAFEYGRLILWRKEQALLDQYINNQYILDEELQADFDAFRAELDKEYEKFNSLLDHAFASNIRSRLKGSVELALTAGVSPDEVLDSVEKIDEFFM